MLEVLVVKCSSFIWYWWLPLYFFLNSFLFVLLTLFHFWLFLHSFSWFTFSSVLLIPKIFLVKNCLLRLKSRFFMPSDISAGRPISHYHSRSEMSKTQFIFLFSKSTDLKKFFSYIPGSVNSIVVLLVTEAKYLGFFLDTSYILPLLMRGKLLGFTYSLIKTIRQYTHAIILSFYNNNGILFSLDIYGNCV